MLRSSSMFSLAGALVSAGAYAQEVPALGAAAQAAPVVAMAEIRRARVELYCDHTEQALAGIRAARESLRAAGGAAAASALAALDQASWLARRSQVAGAEQALDAALAGLDRGMAA